MPLATGNYDQTVHFFFGSDGGCCSFGEEDEMSCDKLDDRDAAGKHADCAFCNTEHQPNYTVVQAAWIYCRGCDTTRLAHIRSATLSVCGSCGLPLPLHPPF